MFAIRPSDDRLDIQIIHALKAALIAFGSPCWLNRLLRVYVQELYVKPTRKPENFYLLLH